MALSKPTRRRHCVLAVGRRSFDTRKEGARAPICLTVYASNLLRLEGKHWVNHYTVANLCANYAMASELG